MSLWCLRCRGSGRRESESGKEHPHCPWLQHCCNGMEKNWSGNLTPPPYKYLRSESSVGSPISPRKGHHKAYSISDPMPIIAGGDNSNSEALNFTRRGHRKAYSISEAVMGGEEMAGMGEPRLLRSGGMRRDWSFEDLRKRVLTRDR